MSWSQLLAGISGVLAGTLAGFFGVGGNLVLVPLLSVLLGLGQQQAQGLTLAALLPPLGLPAVLHYRRAGVPLLVPVIVLALTGFLLGVPVGSVLANLLPGAALRLVFAAFLAFLAFRQWRGLPSGTADERLLHEPPPGRASLVVLAGVAAGLAAGLLGIGGAIALIPAFRRLGMGQRQAQVTSLAVLLAPVGLPGVLVYARAQPSMPWDLLVAIAVGFFGGSLLGARLNLRLGTRQAERGFAVVTGLAALAMAGHVLVELSGR